MLILGRQLPDGKALKIALTKFYGIGRHMAQRVMARYSIHDTIKVGELTQSQITSLASFLSSPATSPRPFRTPYQPHLDSLGDRLRVPSMSEKRVWEHPVHNDHLSELRIESELRRERVDNIAHHRAVGTYVGKRHAMALPARGQRTKNNAKTARKLNRTQRKR